MSRKPPFNGMPQRPVDRPRPIHVVGTAEASGPRVLLISYHFPPGQSVGALRWQKLSHYVAERGWALDVITLDPVCLETSDRSRLADLPQGTRIFAIPEVTLGIERLARATWQLWRRLQARRASRKRAVADSHSPHLSSPDPKESRPSSLSRAEVRWALTSGREYVRAFSAWQDHARSGRWAREAAALARRLLEPSIHMAVITSGPPHMTHEAGRRLSHDTGLPFIMDMRDPWSLSERLYESAASPLWYWLARRHERRAVARAALVVANTEVARRAICEIYGQASDRTITVMNGCDDEPIPQSRHGRRFIVGFAGAIYLQRDPRMLFRAAARVIEELRLEPSDFGIELMGHVDLYGSASVTAIARQEGVERFVTLIPPRPRRDVMEFLSRATMLVSLPLGDNLTIPAKIFEYLRFDAWILALADQTSATGLLLRPTAADVVGPNDLDAIVAVLRKRYREYAAGVRPARIAADGRFSRRAQADVLLEAMVRCTGKAPAPAPAASGWRS